MNIRKQIRVEQAAERQAAHDALSVTEKIQKAHARRGESKRELTKLYALAAKEQAAKRKEVAA